jgi:hypothetical protein
MIGSTDTWVKYVKRIRNNAAHPGQGLGSPTRLIALLHSLQAFLELALLRQLGFSQEHCVRLTKSDLEWRNTATILRFDIPELFEEH